VLFAPTSGRQYYAMLREFEKYQDRFLFLAENGAYVLYHNTEVFSNTMDETVAARVLAKIFTMERNGIYAVLCGKKNAYVCSHNPVFLAEMEKYYTRYTFVEDFSAIDDTILKLSICDVGSADAEHTIYPEMQCFNDVLQVVLSTNYWVDIMNKGINKGVAIQQVQRILGVRPEECAAFGDYLNDLQMMQRVHYSFAMENAHPDIRSAARFHTKSNAAHGVMLSIRDFIEQGLI
jgi:Cof subfamily protein (haloacid dehalogenase superfamily)